MKSIQFGASLGALAACLAACNPADTESGNTASNPAPATDTPAWTISGAAVTLTDSGAFDLRWRADGPVNVYTAAAPQYTTDGAQLVSASDDDGAFSMARMSGAARTYFLLEDAAGRVTPVATRLLPLEGGRNFRDLGGYTTASGAQIAWGRVFRSGVMHELTSSDYQFLGDLDIAVICDFRSNDERADEPTQWDGGPAEIISWDYDMDNSSFAAAFADGEMSAERSAATFAYFYGEMIYSHAPYYADMFDRLASDQLPLAFHCSAGKDRTGVAAALLLSALGVDRETIVADYALSDDYVDYIAEMALSEEEADPNDPNYFWTQLPIEVLAPFLESRPEYIEAAFARIEADHGSVETYLRDVVEVSDDELARIRAALLVD